MDPISIRDVLYYLVAAADGDRVPAGAYDISGPETTTYGELLRRLCADLRQVARRSCPCPAWTPAWCRWVTGCVLPVPGGLAADLVESLDHPMMASDGRLRDLVPDPPGGLVGIDDAIARCAVERSRRARSTRSPTRTIWPTPIRRGPAATRCASGSWRSAVTPPIARPALGLLSARAGARRGACCAPGSTR